MLGQHVQVTAPRLRIATGHQMKLMRSAGCTSVLAAIKAALSGYHL
jgi:hypothetical protein